MRKVQIYKLVDPRYPDIVRYVGKTMMKDIKLRLAGHICSSKELKYWSQRWVNKIMNEGVRPEIHLLEVCDESNWEEKEQFWIKKFRSEHLTNWEDGGRSTTLRKYTVVGTDKNAKKVDKYSINYEYICTYNSASDAARDINGCPEVICAVCNGRQTKAYGLRWKFNSDKEFSKTNHKRATAVSQYDMNGNFIETFISKNEARIKTGVCTSSINYCISGKYTNAGGFIWKITISNDD